MVNMSKRLAHDDSGDSNSSASSDEDDGNFKRRRHRSSESCDDFVSKTLSSFSEPTVLKPVRAVDTRTDKQLIEKQKKASERASKLTTYDDLFDTTEPPDEIDSRSISSSATSGQKAEKAKEANAQVIAKSNEVKETISSSIDKSLDEVYASLEAEGKADISSSKSNSHDPRNNRMDRFSTTSEQPIISKPYNPSLPLKDRINIMLNNRKPMEAYNLMKGEISPIELHKYRDQILVMAKDFFPAIIDSAFDPRSIYIEHPSLIAFANIMKDVFSFKIKSTEFWESVLSSIEKFYRESRIISVPQLAIKLRWIVVQDIREYLIEQSVKIGIKTSDFLLDQRCKLKSNREWHRKQVEANHNQHMADKQSAQSAPEPTVIDSTPVPVVVPATVHIADPRSVPIIPAVLPQREPRMDQPILEEVLPFDDIEPAKPVQAMPQMPFHTNDNGSRRVKDQIFECLANDQIIKFIGMLDRHTQNKTYDFIDYFGDTLRFYACTHPNRPIYEIYLKIHDFIKLEANRFQRSGLQNSNNRLKVIFEKILKQFHETLLYNPKEWLQIREHSLTEQCRQTPCPEKHFHVENNAFNEPMIPIVHNIIISVHKYNLDKFRSTDEVSIIGEVPIINEQSINGEDSIPSAKSSIPIKKPTVSKKNIANKKPIPNRKPIASKKIITKKKLGPNKKITPSKKPIPSQTCIPNQNAVPIQTPIPNQMIIVNNTTMHQTPVPGITPIPSNVAVPNQLPSTNQAPASLMSNHNPSPIKNGIPNAESPSSRDPRLKSGLISLKPKWQSETELQKIKRTVTFSSESEDESEN